ncbi:MAG: hypothetical protein QNK03_08195 [Myxococcota bacterium]|nr:hypothetical protein [Myxococcota bacterium]
MRYSLRLLVGMLAILLEGAAPAGALTIATFEGGGDGFSYTDPDNWNPAVVPLDGAETYRAVLPAGADVTASGLPMSAVVSEVQVADGAALRVEGGSTLTVLGAADLAGTVVVANADSRLRANGPGTALSGGRSQLRAQGGGRLEVAAPSIASLDLWMPYPMTLALLEARGIGSVLDASTATSLDAGFDDGSDAVDNTQLVAADGPSFLNLFGVETITGPVREGDRLDLLLQDGGLIDLSSLRSIASADRGVTRVLLRNGFYEVLMPVLEEADQVIFDLEGGFALVGIEGRLVQTTTEIYSSSESSTTDVIAARVGGSIEDPPFLELSTLEHLDAGFDDGSAALVNVQRVVAGPGTHVSLPMLARVSTPVRPEDRLEFVVSAEASMDLSALRTIESVGSGPVRFEVGGALALGSLSVSVATQNFVTDTVDVDGDYSLSTGSLLSLGSTDAVTGTVEIGGDLDLGITDPDAFRAADGVVGFQGAPPDTVQRLEVAGRDLGTDPGPLPDTNFAIGRLVVGRPFGEPSTLQLVDAIDNGNRSGGSEALYLLGFGAIDGLRIRPGSTLALNRLNAYSFDQASGELVHLNALFGPGETEIPFDEGTLLLPEPATAAAALGALAALGWRRGRRRA